VDALLGHPRVRDMVVALPPDLAATPPAYLVHRDKPVVVVEGGARRQDSVARAFARVPEGADIVVIHDAARPLVSGDLIERTVQAAMEDGAAVAAMRATDTVKRGGADGRVIETLPREHVYLAQTRRRFASPCCGTRWRLLPTPPTRPRCRARGTSRAVGGRGALEREDHDARRPECGRARHRRRSSRIRIGQGYDLHRLVQGRPLILGGVTIPFDLGLMGHSDADIVCHAVTDAVLGAAGLGDIGRHFPDTDPRWKGADSWRCSPPPVALVREAGYAVVNVDVTVIAERPKLAPHAAAMRSNLAGALECAVEQVSVKAKTNEGVESMGAGTSMAAHAVALIARGA
jgi:2-C-methyl-D-erythritol 4-phosphate cytidylyltransferase/2-C-methyl-D-erythritol 2,4-cyclodiphosphate synthase